MTSRIDVLVVLHNSKPLLTRFIESLRKISIPVTLYFLDNDSADGTPEALAQALSDLPVQTHFVRSLRNNGFARGMNLLARMGAGEYMFVLNPDTDMEEGALETLVQKVDSDGRIGICEARQSPREHPKSCDPVTGETTWCSGAAALIRRSAFQAIGGFDESYVVGDFEDSDLCLKLRERGLGCAVDLDVRLCHLVRKSQPPAHERWRLNLTLYNAWLHHRRWAGAIAAAIEPAADKQTGGVEHDDGTGAIAG